MDKMPDGCTEMPDRNARLDSALIELETSVDNSDWIFDENLICVWLVQRGINLDRYRPDLPRVLLVLFSQAYATYKIAAQNLAQLTEINFSQKKLSDLVTQLYKELNPGISKSLSSYVEVVLNLVTNLNQFVSRYPSAASLFNPSETVVAGTLVSPKVGNDSNKGLINGENEVAEFKIIALSIENLERLLANDEDLSKILTRLENQKTNILAAFVSYFGEGIGLHGQDLFYDNEQFNGVQLSDQLWRIIKISVFICVRVDGNGGDFYRYFRRIAEDIYNFTRNNGSEYLSADQAAMLVIYFFSLTHHLASGAEQYVFNHQIFIASLPPLNNYFSATDSVPRIISDMRSLLCSNFGLGRKFKIIEITSKNNVSISITPEQRQGAEIALRSLGLNQNT